MGKVIDVNESDFEQMVLKSKIPVLVDFFGPSCHGCKMLEPVINELSTEYDNKVKFAKIDVSENSRTASRYSVMSIPSIIVFKDGKIAAKTFGYRPKTEIIKTLDGVLG